MNRNRFFGFMALAVAALLAATSSNAQAGFVLSGYSKMTDGSNLFAGIQSTMPSGAANAIVNFAVYENTGDWTTDLDLGTALSLLPATAVDTAAKFVYFYQIINNGVSNISQLQIGAVRGEVTSVGYVVGKVFNDTAPNGGKVGPASNLFLGSATTVGAAADPVADGVPTFAAAGYLGDGATPFAASPAGTDDPTGASKNGPNLFPNGSGSESVRFFWTVLGEAMLHVTDTSPLLFITSDAPYAFFTSAVHDGATTYNELPAPVPLPGTFALLLCGVPGLFGFRTYMRRK